LRSKSVCAIALRQQYHKSNHECTSSINYLALFLCDVVAGAPSGAFVIAG
jgi:hypothetical protein